MPQKSSIDSQFPITVQQVVSSGLLTPPFHKCGRECSRHKEEAVRLALETFGLKELSKNVLQALSGGQMQRTLLARAFVSRPDVLMLDEPLSYLDAKYEHVVCSLLEELRGKATIIVVSHQLAGILDIATRHISVEHGITFDH